MAMVRSSCAPDRLRRHLAVVFALAAMAGGAWAQSEDVKRLTLRHDLLGWEAVGRLDIDGNGFCTGVLVAPDVVMTAAHCLLDSETGARIAPHRVAFRAGLRDGIAVAERSGRRAVAHPRYDPAEEDGARRVRYDVALLQLDAPVSSTDANPFRVDTLAQDTRDVSLVSYARGRSEALSRQGRCAVTGQRGDIFGFDCDATFGSSGAPVFQRRGGQMRIVSLISSGGSQGDQRVALGMALPGVVSDLRAALRTGEGVWPAAAAAQTRRLSVTPDERPGGARFLRP